MNLGHCTIYIYVTRNSISPAYICLDIGRSLTIQGFKNK